MRNDPNMRPFRRVLAAICLLALLALPDAAGAATPPGIPKAHPVPGLATVGPLFSDGVDHQHSCTASVLQARTRDLLLTAAHCVSGTGAGLVFAPGYDRGRTPYGVWAVTEAYVDPSWKQHQDPQHDYAILRVSHQQIAGRSAGVQDVTGGAELIAPTLPDGTEVMVPAYVAGTGDRPIDCVAPLYHSAGYPGFDCGGYLDGTSGAPWLVRSGSTLLVAGVIGGLHQGGCVDYTSYSSVFGLDTYRLWLRALLGLPGDTVPPAGGDGC
jgi:hypothetical protein